MPRWVVIVCAAALSACAARTPPRPSEPGTPHPAAVEEFRQATRDCVGLRTVTAELRLSGRAGGERLRGTLHTGLAAPAAIRFEAVAPFGQPFFILAGRDNRATLLLPREDRVLNDAPVPELLERLTGLRLGAADVRTLLTGCLAEAAAPDDGRLYGNGWRSVTVGEITAYLDTVNGRAVVVAADDGGWRVDYAGHLNGWPRTVRLRTVAGDVDMTAGIEQLEINTELAAEAFEVRVPPGAVPMTLDHLRSVAPLRGTR